MIDPARIRALQLGCLAAAHVWRNGIANPQLHARERFWCFTRMFTGAQIKKEEV